MGGSTYDFTEATTQFFEELKATVLILQIFAKPDMQPRDNSKPAYLYHSQKPLLFISENACKRLQKLKTL